MYTTDDGYIKLDVDGIGNMVMTNGLPLVMPTQHHISTLMEVGETGAVKPVKIPFNPFNEDIVKGDSPSLTKLKDNAEILIGFAIGAVGETLLTVISNKKLQEKLPHSINMFLADVSKVQNGAIKQLADDKSINAWNSIIANAQKTDAGIFSILIKKAANYKGEKYNRLAIGSSAVYDILKEANSETVIYGAKLRSKDLQIFRMIFEYILSFDDNDTIAFGSTNNLAPGFDALYTLYTKCIAKTNSILKELAFVNQATADAAILPLADIILSPDAIINYKRELVSIPSEIDIARNRMQQTTNVQRAQVEEPLPLGARQSAQQDDGDVINKILYGNSNQNIQQMPLAQQQIPRGGQQQMPVQQNPWNNQLQQQLNPYANNMMYPPMNNGMMGYQNQVMPNMYNMGMVNQNVAPW